MVKDILKLNRNPYICIPVTGKTHSDVIRQLKEIIPLQPDIIEWRGDYYEKIDDVETSISLLKEIKQITSIPLLFTIRSVEEGGESTLIKNKKALLHILEKVCSTSLIDVIDIEMANEESSIKHLQDVAEDHNVKTILSYHNFVETPQRDNLLKVGRNAAKLGGDIIKIAVMPKVKSDVLNLLHVTNELDQSLGIPIVTMSMGELGKMTRLIGWSYGSVMTFAVGKKASAPGQLPILKLRETINQTQTLLQINQGNS